MSLTDAVRSSAVETVLGAVRTHFVYTPGTGGVTAEDVVETIEDACIKNQVPTTLLPIPLASLLYDARWRLRNRSNALFDRQEVTAVINGF